MLSNCCDASPIENTDLCSSCKEHCDFYPENCPHCDVLIEDSDLDYCTKCGAEIPLTVDPF
jgi:hypothetical protein